MAKEWKAEPKAGAGAAIRKKYERLLLAFERQLAEGAPQRALPNPQAAKAAQKQVACCSSPQSAHGLTRAEHACTVGSTGLHEARQGRRSTSWAIINMGVC